MAEKPRTYTSEYEVTLLKDIFYRKEYQAAALLELMAPALIFDRIWPKIQVPDYSFSRPVQSASGTRFSDASDPRKEYAPPFQYGAESPLTTISPGQYKSYTIEQLANGFGVGLDARENTININWIAKTRQRKGYWFAEQINAKIVADVTNSFSVTNTDSTTMADKMEHVATDYGVETTLGHLTGILDSSYYWDEPGADPVTDIMDLSTVYNTQSGYPFVLTDIYMTTNAANMLSKFVVRSGGKWAKDPTSDGFMTDKVAGIAFHALKGDEAGWNVTVGDDYIMGLDRSRPAATTYYHTSSELPSVGDMNVHSWFNDELLVQYYRFIFSRMTLLEEPNGLCVLKVRD